MVASGGAERCNSCDEGALVCSRCEGSGWYSSTDGLYETFYKCPWCAGRGYWECSLCFGRRTQRIITSVIERIEGLDLPDNKKNHLISVFDKLCSNKKIRLYIEEAQISSVIQRINRHDFQHALHVTNNAVRLFEYMCSPGDSAPFPPSISPTLSLEVILISAFCHDIKRGFGNHAKVGASAIKPIIDEFYHDVGLPNDTRIVLAVESCVFHHPGYKEVPPNIEDTILTLADGLDCGPHRVQPGFQAALIFREDKDPMKYFSNKWVKGVDFSSTDSHVVKFVFHICDGAALSLALELKRRVENTMLSRSQNRNNFAIVVRHTGRKLPGWKSDTMKIWPLDELRKE